MPVAVVMEFKDGTLEQYDQVIERMGFTPGGAGAPAGLFHWVTQTDDGLIVTDVEADDHRLRVNGSQSPTEAGLAVMGIGATDQPEHEALEPGLDGADCRVYLGAPVRRRHRIGVLGIGGPELVDQGATSVRVGFVPAVQVPLDQVCHRIRLSKMGFVEVDAPIVASPQRRVDYVRGKAKP